MYQRFRLTTSNARKVFLWGLTVPVLTYYAASYTDVSLLSSLYSISAREPCLSIWFSPENETLSSCFRLETELTNWTVHIMNCRTDGSFAERLDRTLCFVTNLLLQLLRLVRSKGRAGVHQFRRHAIVFGPARSCPIV